MKQIIVILIVATFFVACSSKSSKKAIEVDKNMLLTNLQILSHDSLEGRGFGTEGNYKARLFIAQQFKNKGFDPAFEEGYSQPFEHTIGGRRRQRAFPVAGPGENFSNVPDTTLLGANLISVIKGETESMIVVTAHHDHLGIIRGSIYNGADDDASGIAALFAIGEYFKSKKPKHTIVLAAVDAEEVGLAGARYLAANFPWDLEKVVLNVNMDMIAHSDSMKLWATGLYHNPQLEPPLKSISSPITLHFGHDDPDDPVLDDWTDNSDHMAFHERGIPFMYFGVDDHEDYHAPTDVFENINPDFYVEAVKLIIQAIEGYDELLD